MIHDNVRIEVQLLNILSVQTMAVISVKGVPAYQSDTSSSSWALNPFFNAALHPSSEQTPSTRSRSTCVSDLSLQQGAAADAAAAP